MIFPCLLHQEKKLGYTEMPKYQALQLPYNDRQTLATIILPKAGLDWMFRGHDVKLDWFVLPIFLKKNHQKNILSLRLG
jgi:hypothetical protein